MGDSEVTLHSETNRVWRRGDVVLRDAAPHSTSVHALLRHLEAGGFPGAPRVVGSGFDDEGNEMLTFLPGDFAHPCLPSAEAAFELGRMVRQLHAACADFEPPHEAVWRPWFIRDLGDGPRLIAHCDVSPWNVLLRDGRPVALIDWDLAGPVDPLIDFAWAAWLNAGLYGPEVFQDGVLGAEGDRAARLAAIVEGFELASRDRSGFVDRMIDVAACAAAAAADEHRVTRWSALTDAQWAMAWMARSAAWMVQHRRVLARAMDVA